MQGSDITSDEQIPIPDALRSELQRRLRGCKDVKIYHLMPESGSSKIAGTVKVQAKPDELPEQDIDEIAQDVVRLIDDHYEENADEDQRPQLKYRLYFRCMLTDRGDKQPKLRQLSFEYTYSGTDSIAPSIVSTASAEEIDDLRNELLRQSLNQNDRLFGRVLEMSQALIDMATHADKINAPLMGAMQFMGGMWHEGAQMQRNAMHMMFDQSRAREEALSKERRFDKLAKMAEPMVEIMVPQFLGWVHHRMKMPGEPPTARTRTNGRRRHEESSGAANDTSAAPEAEPQRITTMDLINMVGSTLHPAQHAAMQALLTKVEHALLLRFLASPTIDDACVAWQEITRGGIKFDKLLQLQGLLEDEQREGFMALQQCMAAEINARAASE